MRVRADPVSLLAQPSMPGIRVVAVCVSDDRRFGDCLVALTEQGSKKMMMMMVLSQHSSSSRSSFVLLVTVTQKTQLEFHPSDVSII
jgi:hypothetical protein